MFEKDVHRTIKCLNSAAKYFIKNPMWIVIPVMDLNIAQIVNFSKASFVNNINYTTQLRYDIFVADCEHNSLPIHFNSYKSHVVLHSKLGDELIALSNMI